MFCEKCETVIEGDGDFCPKCGARLTPIEEKCQQGEENSQVSEKKEYLFEWIKQFSYLTLKKVETKVNLDHRSMTSETTTYHLGFIKGKTKTLILPLNNIKEVQIKRLVTYSDMAFAGLFIAGGFVNPIYFLLAALFIWTGLNTSIVITTGLATKILIPASSKSEAENFVWALNENKGGQIQDNESKSGVTSLAQPKNDMKTPPSETGNRNAIMCITKKQQRNKKVIWIVGLIFGMIAVCIGLATYNNNSYILMVKDGYNTSYPNSTYGVAFENFFGSPTWTYFKSDGGEDVVEFTGDCTYQNAKVKAKQQFVLNMDEGTFEVGALSFNDIPQNKLITAVLMNEVFENNSDTVQDTKNSSAASTKTTSNKQASVDQKKQALQAAVKYAASKGMKAVMSEPYGNPKAGDLIVDLDNFSNNKALINVGYYQSEWQVGWEFERLPSGEWKYVKDVEVSYD